MRFADAAGHAGGHGTAVMNDLPGAEVRLERRRPSSREDASGLDDLNMLLQQRRTGMSVPDNIRDAVEAQLGHALGDVRLHTDADAARVADRLGARALAVGQDVYFGAGELDTSSREGWRLLTHELAHTVQTGPAVPSGELRLGAADSAAERDADHVADSVVAQSWRSLAAPVKAAAPVAPARAPMTGLSPQVVRRKHKQVAADVKGAGALMLMTLADLHRHAETQLDWANNSTITAIQREQLWTWVHFARESDGILSGCGKFTIADLQLGAAKDDEKDALRAYGGAMTAKAPGVSLDKAAANVTAAINWGDAIAKLNITPGTVVMKRIVNQEAFEKLMGVAGGVDKMIDYVKTCNPVLHAEDGAEVDSIADMISDGIDYKAMNKALPEIRSYHRFEKAALDQLVINKGVKGNAKPFTLILHSALDHNGAFHRDAELTKLIVHPTNFTLMIEGAKTLGAVAGDVEKLAKKYGKGGKIDQVMIAGHGNSESIELAGDVQVKGNKLDTTDNALYGGGDVDSDKVFDQIIKYMDPKSPNHRVVFNACLTNSNDVPASAVTKSSAASQQEVRKYIRNNPSITTYLKTKKPQLDVRGANGSIYTVELVEASGAITIKDADDPMAMGTKLEYVELGTEAGGVLRAVVESYAHNKGKCIKAMKKRLAAPKGNIQHKKTVHILFTIITAAKAGVLKLAASLVNPAEHVPGLVQEAECRVEHVKAPKTPAAHITQILGYMVTNVNWSNMPRVPLVMHQAMLAHRGAAVKDVLTVAGDTKLDCQTAEDYVDFSVTKPYLAAMMAKSGATLSRGKQLLALLSVASGNTDPACEKLLKTLVKKAGGKRLPATTSALLAGAISEDQILVKLGVKRAVRKAGSKAPVKGPDPDANVDLDNDGTNETYVEPMSAKATLLGPVPTDVFKTPKAAVTIKTLATPKDVMIVGKHKTLYAIQMADGTIGYIYNGGVRVQ